MSDIAGTILCGVCIGLCLLPWLIETIADLRK